MVRGSSRVGRVGLWGAETSSTCWCSRECCDRCLTPPSSDADGDVDGDTDTAWAWLSSDNASAVGHDAGSCFTSLAVCNAAAAIGRAIGGDAGVGS